MTTVLFHNVVSPKLSHKWRMNTMECSPVWKLLLQPVVDYGCLHLHHHCPRPTVRWQAADTPRPEQLRLSLTPFTRHTSHKRGGNGGNSWRHESTGRTNCWGSPLFKVSVERWVCCLVPWNMHSQTFNTNYQPREYLMGNTAGKTFFFSFFNFHILGNLLS